MAVSSGKDLRSLGSFRDDIDIAMCVEEEKGVSLKLRFEGVRGLVLAGREESVGFAGVRVKVAVVAIFVVSVFVLQSCS
jgi:hypothetical protein